MRGQELRRVRGHALPIRNPKNPFEDSTSLNHSHFFPTILLQKKRGFMKPVEEILYSEKQVLEMLSLMKWELAKLRREGLPYIQLSKRSRSYLWSDRLQFAVSRRVSNSDVSMSDPRYS